MARGSSARALRSGPHRAGSPSAVRWTPAIGRRAREGGLDRGGWIEVEFGSERAEIETFHKFVLEFVLSKLSYNKVLLM